MQPLSQDWKDRDEQLVQIRLQRLKSWISPGAATETIAVPGAGSTHTDEPAPFFGFPLLSGPVLLHSDALLQGSSLPFSWLVHMSIISRNTIEDTFQKYALQIS